MLSVTNPANGQVIATLEADSASNIEVKFKRAKLAQSQWRRVSIADRINVIKKWGDLLDAQLEDLAQTLTREVGKPITQSRNEIRGVASRLAFFCDHVESVIKTERLSSAGESTQEEIEHEPLGVIANISAWNYPYFVGANVFLPALLTGNAVMYKPSEFASLTGLKIAALFKEAGLPDDVFTSIIGKGDVGQALLQQNVDGIFFTGSYATGSKIAQNAHQRMIRLQLELGGKDPVYVCDDANVEVSAASLVEGVFYNTGQSCCSVERIYVHDRIYEAFVHAFKEATSLLMVGDPAHDNTFVGPLTRAAQLDVLDEQVQDALQKGATLELGGHRLEQPGYFYAPTLLTHVNHDMLVMREESFGPIIGIQRVGSDDEALSLMNDNAYGLTSGVYSASEQRARRLLAGVDTGSVYWNCCDRVSPRLPWSGRKHSGLGVTLSVEGIRAFVKPKAWHLRA
jgi:acyl-CoA reductase-like NAD-dependent aldehyde dehydrogenase